MTCQPADLVAPVQSDPPHRLLRADTLRAGKPVALVCHAHGVLRHVTNKEGTPVVQGRPVTGFTNTEEKAVGLTDEVSVQVSA